MKWWHYKEPNRPIEKKRGSALERFMFLAIIQEDECCWLWEGSLDPRGYGRLADEDGWMDMAHRWAYKHFVGAIPKGLVLDHLCGVTMCVNPQHLEPVTHRENIINRGITNAAYINAQKSICKNGHPYSKDNTYLSKSKYGQVRACRVCHKIATKKYREKLAKISMHQHNVSIS